MNDQTVTAPGLRRLAERERFLAFAFTAADILLEVDAERRIVFAAGAAVKFRLGVPAEALLGRGAETLVAAADRPGFIAAFDALLARDYALLLGVFLCTAVLTVVFNLLTDLVYAWIDPRVAVA